MHETLVREVVNAHTAGQLEPDVALRALAVELHSIKGVASILGCTPVATMIGSLQKVLEFLNPSNTLAAQTYMILFIILFIKLD